MTPNDTPTDGIDRLEFVTEDGETIAEMPVDDDMKIVDLGCAYKPVTPEEAKSEMYDPYPVYDSLEEYRVNLDK